MTIENKATLNKGGVFVPLVNRGKDKKLIPWSLINKETVMPSVKHCTSPKYGIDVYVVDKMVNGQKLSQVFSTKREALKAIDILLIRNGREPEHILKRS
jgi:hypothetical protein